jgi:integrase
VVDDVPGDVAFSDVLRRDLAGRVDGVEPSLGDTGEAEAPFVDVGAAVGGEHWTIRDHRKHLAAILRWAEGQKMRRGDPLRFVPPPRKTRSTKRAFTDSEAELFVAACQEEDELYGPLFIVMLSMGHRPGESTGLSWPAIDWDAGTIRTDEALKRVAGRPVAVGDTKNEKKRTLRVPPVVVEALRVEQVRQDVARMSAGAAWPRQWHGLVFLGIDERYPKALGRPHNSKTISKHLTRVCQLAGVPRLTPYELRHTRGDVLLRRDVSPSKVADALGTSERMLRDHYHHVDPIIDVL